MTSEGPDAGRPLPRSSRRGRPVRGRPGAARGRKRGESAPARRRSGLPRRPAAIGHRHRIACPADRTGRPVRRRGWARPPPRTGPHGPNGPHARVPEAGPRPAPGHRRPSKRRAWAGTDTRHRRSRRLIWPGLSGTLRPRAKGGDEWPTRRSRHDLQARNTDPETGSCARCGTYR